MTGSDLQLSIETEQERKLDIHLYKNIFNSVICPGPDPIKQFSWLTKTFSVFYVKLGRFIINNMYQTCKLNSENRKAKKCFMGWQLFLSCNIHWKQFFLLQLTRDKMLSFKFYVIPTKLLITLYLLYGFIFYKKKYFQRNLLCFIKIT